MTAGCELIDRKPCLLNFAIKDETVEVSGCRGDSHQGKIGIFPIIIVIKLIMRIKIIIAIIFNKKKKMLKNNEK